MAELRYRGFISYSHKDKSWATWLHNALESYRVPQKLVGTNTNRGRIPARIRPVFRDRDDLSSATDLQDTVRLALSEAENLIVLCSPDAVASHWVNEEIREFARLGRADRIFCIVVGDEPIAEETGIHYFPPALTEVGLQEPLAADAREWADGKYVAKLKLIAGLLGLRLDELRQRDLQRRRRRQVIIALGIIAGLMLTATTIVSQISKQQEREKAEQLATFIVDLGERLKSGVDLETLAIISAESFKHLQGLDPDSLSPETAKKVALSLRQMGRVSQLQGRPDEALEAFQRSHELLSRLSGKHPANQDLLFELGNAEYYIGNLHYEQGRYEKALESMQRYYRQTQTLLEADPDNPNWIMEMASAHNNVAALQLGSGRGVSREALEHVEEATRLKELVMSMRPDDQAVADSYSNTLAWAADAQYQACNLEQAMAVRNRARELAEYSMRLNPANNSLKKHYAYSLTGVARLQIALGQLETAESNLQLAISTLQQLSAADPSNVVYAEEALYRRVMLATLLADAGQLESAKSMVRELDFKFQSLGGNTSQGVTNKKEYLKLLLASADIEFQLGNRESANLLIKTIIGLQSSDSGSRDGDMFDTHNLVKTRYQWWRLNGSDDIDDLPPVPNLDQDLNIEFRSCLDADSAARMHIIAGDRIAATSESVYLQSRGYAHPNFIRFCTDNGLCAE